MNSVKSLLSYPFRMRTVEEKLEVKRLGRPTPELPTLKLTVNSVARSYNRRFNTETYEKCSWMCGCEDAAALFCFPCLLFEGYGENSWSKTGFKDLNHLAGRVRKHEESYVHINNCLKLALLGSSDIAKHLDSAFRKSIDAHNEQVKQNRHVLNIIINCIRFCGAFELAMRGHDEKEVSKNPGIFRGLVDFSGELDLSLKNHLQKANAFKGISKTIQNELLQLMLEVSQEKIAEEIREANLLSVIVDETSDISNKFQIAVVFRYIVKNKPVERFWAFLDPPSHDPEGLASCILEELIQKHKLENTPNKLIAQTFNGASVMRYVHKGVQSKLKNKFPEAQYIHCYAHELNHVLVKAASTNRSVRVFFANLQGICTFFSTNAQRLAVLNEIVQARLQSSAPTKWNFQSKSVKTVYEHREDLIKCMVKMVESDEIQSDATIDQAGGHISKLFSPDFIFWLSFFYKISPLIDTFNNLKKVPTDTIDVEKCIAKFEESVSYIKNSILESETPETSHQNKRFKIDNSDHESESLEVCDTIVSHIKERFSFTGHLLAAGLFSPSHFHHYEKVFPDTVLKSVCEEYTFLNEKKLSSELNVLYESLEFRCMSGAVSLYRFFKDCGLQEAFSESLKLLEVIITIPMTTSEPDRCFPTLNRIKTFLQNTVSEERLTALAMLSIEKDFVMDIPDFNQKVTDKFASLEGRKTDFNYK